MGEYINHTSKIEKTASQALITKRYINFGVNGMDSYGAMAASGQNTKYTASMLQKDRCSFNGNQCTRSSSVPRLDSIMEFSQSEQHLRHGTAFRPPPSGSQME